MTWFMYFSSWCNLRVRSISLYLLILDGRMGSIMSVAEIHFFGLIWILKMGVSVSCNLTKSVYRLETIHAFLEPSKDWTHIKNSMKSPVVALIHFLNWILKIGLFKGWTIGWFELRCSSNEFFLPFFCPIGMAYVLPYVRILWSFKVYEPVFFILALNCYYLSNSLIKRCGCLSRLGF